MTGIANGIALPNALANGQTTDASLVMANYNALLVALNRALLDAGGGAGMNAFGSQIHNLAAGSVSTDAVNLGQLGGYLPLAGGSLTGALTAAAGLTVATQTTSDNSTQAASTAFVQANLTALLATIASTYAPLASPAFTGAPTAPTATVGANTTQIATCAFVQANSGMGISTQQWQDVSGSRALGTVYTNNTGRGIQVCVQIGPGAVTTANGVQVGSQLIANLRNVTGVGTQFFAFDVPAGATYQVGASSTTSIATWVEMR